MNKFFEVWDIYGTYGFFQDKKLAEKCAAFFEKENYSDEPNEVHVYVHSHSFDDFYWMQN